jgi:CBS domain-containing protein
MNTVAAVLTRKNMLPVCAPSATTVLEALRIMAEKNIGSLVVMNEGVYSGIVTERDYSRKVILLGRNSTETTIAEIMSINLPTVVPADKIEHCMQLLSQNNIRYLPVMENGLLVGIISMSDVVKETILAQKETIHQLQNYIQS